MYRIMLALLFITGSAFAQQPGQNTLHVGGGDGDPVDGGATITSVGNVNTDGNVDANSFLVNGVLIQLGDMSNVDLTGLADNDVLQYNSGTGNFEPVPFTGTSLGDLTDVTITAAATGDMIQYDGAAWVDVAATLSILADADTTGVTDKDVLYYVTANTRFERFDVTGATDINIKLTHLNDVNEAGLTDGQVLAWDTGTSKWIPADPTAITSIGDLSDVTITSPIDRAPLIYNSGSAIWVDDSYALPKFNITTPGNYSVLQYNSPSGEWADSPNLELAEGTKIKFIDGSAVETDVVSSSDAGQLTFGDLFSFTDHRFNMDGGTAVWFHSVSAAGNDNQFTFNGDIIVGRELFPSAAQGIRGAQVSTPLRIRSFEDTAEMQFTQDKITVVDGSFGLGNATEIGNLFIAGPSGNDRYIDLYSGNVSPTNKRAEFGIDDSAETGSNAGSKLYFSVFDDNGLNEIKVLEFDRAAPAISTATNFIMSGATSYLAYTGGTGTLKFGDLTEFATTVGVESDATSIMIGTTGTGSNINIVANDGATAGDVILGWGAAGIDQFLIEDFDGDTMLDFGKISTVATLDLISNDSNANGEVAAQFRYSAVNDNVTPEQIIYAQESTEIAIVTDGNEHGEYILDVMHAGVLDEAYRASNGNIYTDWTVNIGVDDTSQGLLIGYGNATTSGHIHRFYNGGTEGATTEYYDLEADNDYFRLKDASANTLISFRDVGTAGSIEGVYNITVTNQMATENFIRVKEVTAPATPPAGYGYIYALTTDGNLYYKDDTGSAYDLTLAGGGGGALGDLSDVTITAAATGDYLRYNGTAWVDSGPNQVFVGDLDLQGADLTNSTGNIALSANSGTGSITTTGEILVDSTDTTFDFLGTTRNYIGSFVSDGSTDVLGITAYNTTANSGASLWMGASRGTESSPTAVSNGDRVGQITFFGHNGTDYDVTAGILAVVNDPDGTPNNGDMPGYLSLEATHDGADVGTRKAWAIEEGFFAHDLYATPDNVVGNRDRAGMIVETVQTTNATATEIANITTTIGELYSIRAFIIGQKTDGSQRYSTVANFIYYRGAISLAELVDNSVELLDEDGSWSVDGVVDGSNNISIRVTGNTGDTVNWVARLMLTQVED